MADVPWDEEPTLYSCIVLAGGPARERAVAAPASLDWCVHLATNQQGVPRYTLLIRTLSGVTYDAAAIKALASMGGRPALN
jgi:hypothetical protein